MVTTRSQTAKQATGFKGPPPLLKKIKARASKAPVSKPAKYPATVHNLRLRQSSGEAKRQRKIRLQRLQRLVLGYNRQFSGSIHIPDPVTARQTDAQRLSSIKDLVALGTAVVYWVDGSWREGFMGAGVVWQDQSHICSAQYKLGRYTGDSADAEIFAIAAALGRARKEVERNRDIRIVKVFSDSQGILLALQKGKHTHFGPMLAKKTALEGLYERADTLNAQGVVVELVWVKGHFLSQGNRLADNVADDAVREQMNQQGSPSVPKRTIPATLADVPKMWQEMGSDWMEEWLHCANVHLHGPSRRKQRRLEKTLAAINQQLSQEPSQRFQEASTVNYISSIPNTQRAFILPKLGLYGNLTIDQIIDGLCKRRDAVDYQILEVQRFIASTTGEEVRNYLKNNIAELSDERDGINEEIEAQLVVLRLGKQVDAGEEAIVVTKEVAAAYEESKARDLLQLTDKAEVGAPNDEEGRWVGDVLLMMLDTLRVADDQLEDLDTDEELERQIRGDIALAQRSMSTTTVLA
jgi:ribonuclease HI